MAAKHLTETLAFLVVGLHSLGERLRPIQTLHLLHLLVGALRLGQGCVHVALLLAKVVHVLVWLRNVGQVGLTADPLSSYLFNSFA